MNGGRSVERSYGDKSVGKVLAESRSHGARNQVGAASSAQRDGAGNGSGRKDENKENDDVHMKGNKVASISSNRVLTSASEKLKSNDTQVNELTTFHA